MLAISGDLQLNQSMRGTAQAQISFTSIDVIVEDLLEEEGFLVALREARETLFRDEEFDVLYPSGRGRPSHPPSVLAALLLAQLFYGVSDREAERRSRLDLSWKDALGLPLEHRGIPHVCLVEFRARVVRGDMAGVFNEKLLQLAKRAGVVGHRRVVDSTGMSDCVVTMDTITLIRSASRHCLERFATIDKKNARQLASQLRRSDYDREAKPQINWSQPDERRALVNELFFDAEDIIAACDNNDDVALQQDVDLLRVVAGQDIEHDEEGGVSIRRGVAQDRLISTVDPDARHGHRSRSDRYDGYKAHLSVDVDSDLVTGACVTIATTSDATALSDLIDNDPVAIKEIIADTHYGHAATRRSLLDAQIELTAPAQPSPAKKGLFNKDDFAIDLEQKTVTCPAGVTVSFRTTKAKRPQAHFGTHCTNCALQAKCTTRTDGRIVEINPEEELLAAARALRWTEEFRDRYRERARVERKNAQLKFRTRKIPWRGLVKADAWVKIRTAALNLDRMGRMPGLIG